MTRVATALALYGATVRRLYVHGYAGDGLCHGPVSPRVPRPSWSSCPPCLHLVQAALDNDKAGGRYQAAADLQAEVERLEGALAKAEAERDAAAKRAEELGALTDRAWKGGHARGLAEGGSALVELLRADVARLTASLAERDAVIGELNGAALRHCREDTPESLAALSLALLRSAPHAARGAAVIREAEERGAAWMSAHAAWENHGKGSPAVDDIDRAAAVSVCNRARLAAEGKEAGQ